MLKIIHILTKFVVAFIISILFSSCKHNLNFGNDVEGNGNITTETRTISEDFKSIAVSTAIQVTIEQSNTKSILVVADSNLQEIINTTVENGILVIHPKESFDASQTPKIIIKMPIIEALEAASGSEIRSINTLKGGDLSIATSCAAAVNVNIEFENIIIDASSRSTITANGKAIKLTTSASSGSKIIAKNLFVNQVTADASSGAEIIVHPILSLNAEASSGAQIKYHRNPKTIRRKTSSGGSIDKK